MKARALQYLTLIVLNGCISAYNLEHDTNEALLVVDGKITQENSPHELILRRSNATGSTEFNVIRGARVTLFDVAGNSEDYYEEGDGKYILYGTELARIPGISYYIEIILPDERIYRSKPQKMPEVIQPDTLYFSMEEIEELSDLQNTMIKQYLNFYINTPLTVGDQPSYILWRMDHAYSFAELFCHPLKPPATCYITRKLTNDEIKLFSSEDISGNELEDFLVGSIRLFPSWEFFEKHFFNVAQHAITPEAFEYWETVKMVAQSTGSIFDTPPGPINGNVYNIEDPNERVLGFFEVSAVDTIRTYTFAHELEPLFIEDLCNPYDWRPQRSAVCCNCLEIPDSQLERPAYWGYTRNE